ncbi:hypothetical protein SpiGrapes_1097 [Sphaerochaeta pleomorpha str. Grapes]|uniref:Uncharacterized protein n=1 Tax=Sphaerochaeta pleomorpha (strain ATCC BAA-1885 / DSM 22778 / Grapes) TaxID=158190 RepID=G8QS59_SPHPG|nr:hypothetical protein [Sphaerochaeta pleomorpha]AEV28920.1 hypothetical protein SpiGrapes_1097 [Sphaerochaeta pleomorpha str. Grapes]
MVKKLASLLLIALLMAIFATSLFATPEPVVVRLHGYIPETTTFKTTDSGFEVISNANNFTYSVIQGNGTSSLFIVAK